MGLVMLLMLCFSLLLSNSVSAIVLQPLELLLSNVKKMASTIFKSVTAMAATMSAGNEGATATAAIQLFLVFVLFETACIMLRILPRELYWWTVGNTRIVPNRQVVFADLQIGEGYGPVDLLLVLGVGSLE